GPERPLEAQAVSGVLQLYQLPDSDRPLVMRNGRNEVRALLFAMVEQAMQKDPSARTADEQFIVDAFKRLVRDKRVQAAAASQTEYRKWRADPCAYRPPAGFTYDATSACFGASRLFTPESPGIKAFAAYGVASAYKGAKDDPSALTAFSDTANAALTGISYAFVFGGAAAGTALAAALPVGLVAAGVPGAFQTIKGFMTNISYFVHFTYNVGSTTSAAFSVVSPLLIIVASLSTAIVAGNSVFAEAAIPDGLQGLVNSAPNYDIEYIIKNCNAVTVCFSATSSNQRDDADRELFGTFMLATLPDYPGIAPAPAPQQGDAKLIVSGNPVDWLQYTADDGEQRAVRMSGGWFADRPGSAGASDTRLTLSISYRDAAGAKWTARRVGNQFLIARTDVSPTDANYPAPRQSADLTVVDWNSNTVTAQVGGG
ncbi:MAG TPA: hypothetical protein VK821_07335, partial [Dehalococcoidia bacterium]|nr:hypothetical protein [Dehalococcoidia bacterium]